MQISYSTVAQLIDCASKQELVRLAHALISEFGPVSWVYAFVSKEMDADFQWLGAYPDKWVGHYRANQYEKVDPAIRHSIEHSTPFVWPDYRKLPNDEKSLRNPTNRIFLEAHEFGLNGGITVPLHRGVRWGVLSLAFSRTKDAEEACRRMPDLFLLSHQLHEKGLTLLDSEQVADVPPLSPLEIECLRLAATGMTSEGIAARLNRKVRAITDVFQSINRKLGTNNRQAAVAFAVSRKIIQL